MSIPKYSLLAVVLLLALLMNSCQPKKESAHHEQEKLFSQIKYLEQIIGNNGQLIQKLKIHEARLKAMGANPTVPRMPVVIAGQAVYMTCEESVMEDLSNALALQDLLKAYHANKGGFRSDDPAIWKNYLIKQSTGGREHNLQDELSAIQKRLAALQEEIQTLESNRDILLKKHKQ